MKIWEDLVLETAERFGGTFPHPETSEAIATVHQRAPNAVERTIDEVATDYAAGSINSPWGILRSRVQKIRADVTAKATAANQTSKAIARAEQWMRTAGLHHDRETELLDELYGERGRLKNHPETQDRMLALWHELRPTGEQLDQDAIDRGHRYQQQRARLANTPPSETPEQRLQRQRELAAKKAVIAHHEQPPSVYESDTMRLA